MKTLFKTIFTSSLLALTIVFFAGCDDDDPGPQLTGNSETYTLSPMSNPTVSGTVTFAERDDDQVVITIALTGTSAGSMHPAHIHANSAAEGGGIVLDLADVDGATGKSETVVKALNDGTAISYEDLVDFNGYVNVHLSSSDLGTLIAQADIGQNELTGDKEEYTLNELNASGVSGTAVFEKRKNGKTKVTLALEGTVEGGDHPAHIHANNAATGGGIVLDLKNVNGATGMSVTSANALRDGTAITYDELIAYNGHINVHLSPTNLGTRIAQGDIGSNAP